jgi:hypothetical protein
MTPEHPLPEEVEKAISEAIKAAYNLGHTNAYIAASDMRQKATDRFNEAKAVLRSAISSALAAKAGEGNGQ